MFSWLGPKAMRAMLSISRTYENLLTAKYKRTASRTRACKYIVGQETTRIQYAVPTKKMFLRIRFVGW